MLLLKNAHCISGQYRSFTSYLKSKLRSVKALSNTSVMLSNPFVQFTISMIQLQEEEEKKQLI